MNNWQKTENRRQEIVKSLSKISLKSAKILKEIAENKNPVVDTQFLKTRTNLPGKELGASLGALTTIKINNTQLIEKIIFREGRSNSKYFWNSDAASKGEVFLVLKEIFEKYGF